MRATANNLYSPIDAGKRWREGQQSGTGESPEADGGVGAVGCGDHSTAHSQCPLWPAGQAAGSNNGGSSEDGVSLGSSQAADDATCGRGLAGGSRQRGRASRDGDESSASSGEQLTQQSSLSGKSTQPPTSTQAHQELLGHACWVPCLSPPVLISVMGWVCLVEGTGAKELFILSALLR